MGKWAPISENYQWEQISIFYQTIEHLQIPHIKKDIGLKPSKN